MAEHEKVFFSILRSALWGTPVEIPGRFSKWNAIMKLAKSQALLGLVADVLLTKNEIRDSLPANFVEMLQKIPMTTLGMYAKMNITLQHLVLTLRKAGVEPVLLKGQGLSKYYPVPELRQCGDIDIYVGKENYEKAYDAIIPIVSEIEDRSTIWSHIHFHASIGAVTIEVHYKADYLTISSTQGFYQTIVNDGLSKDLHPIRFGEVDVMTPNDTYNTFYIFHHLWRHFSSSGVGLRQFCDWACFLHAHVDKLDLPYLEKMLEDLGFMKPWQVLGCFLVKDLGLPEDEFPFYNKRYVAKVDRVREYVMTDGNFGVNVSAGREKSRGYLHGKWVSFKYHILRFFRMFAIFPKHTMLRLNYTLKRGVAQVFKDLRKRINKDR